ISARSSDVSEGRVDTSAVFFTTTNWMTPQQIKVTGLNDVFIDGNQQFTVILDNPVSNDASYAALNPPDVVVTNTDDDVAGFVVTSWDAEASEYYVHGNAAEAKIRLTKPPAGDVTIPVYSSDTGEGVVAVSSLTFTKANWDQYQTVFVQGLDDEFFDGNQQISVVFGPASS
ncbi:MAG: hypothetical protein RRB13_16665, partial [bacterium]|nr:hypothetical protein [bacterium]